MCARGSVTELVRALLDDGKKMDEILIAHVLKETLEVKTWKLNLNHISLQNCDLNLTLC